MPRHAPIMKVNNCKSFGAVVLNRGIDLAEVDNRLRKFWIEKSFVFILVETISVEIGQNVGFEIYQWVRRNMKLKFVYVEYENV